MESFLLNIIDSMIEHLNQSEIDCINIDSINNFKIITYQYFNNLKSISKVNEFRQSTIEYINEINKLNKDCNYQLIKADQRELIISLIYVSADNFNYNIETSFIDEYRNW